MPEALLSALGLTDAEIPTVIALYGSEAEAVTVLRRMFAEDVERRAAEKGQQAAGEFVRQAVDEAQAALPTIFDTGE